LSLSKAIVKSLGINERDNVTIYFYPHTLRLAEETAKECFKKGADVLLNLYTDRYYESYLTHLTEESLRQPSDYCRALAGVSTVEILLGGAYDPSFFRKILPSRLAATNEGERKAHYPRDRRPTRMVNVQIGTVTRPRAKLHGYDYMKWRRMVERASLVDPTTLSRIGRKVSSVLSKAKNVVVTAPNGTHLQLKLKGKPSFIDDGLIDRNDLRKGFASIEIPAGSVTIIPDETSADGRIAFNLPILWRGRVIRRLEWDFKGGRIQRFEGDAVAMALRSFWEKATGDRDRVSRLTVGINPHARPGFSLNPISLGAVSVAVGNNQDLRGRNKSTFHFQGSIRDANLVTDGRILVKAGKLIQ